MECDICSRIPGQNLPFYCTTCARAITYTLRVEAVKVLLDKEDLANKIQDIVEDGSNPSTTPASLGATLNADLSRVWSVKTKKLLTDGSEERTREMDEHIELLKKSTEQLKLDISSRRKELQEQQSSLDRLRAEVSEGQRRESSKVSEVTEKTSRSFEAMNKNSQEFKGFLCREVALLLRFKQKKRKKDGIVKDQYSISGLPVPDLREINGLKCYELTASIALITHLLALASFYLSVRLPAEITVPHRAYPQPTIFTPANSYLSKPKLFSATATTQSSSTSPTTSRHGDAKAPPRPWPLFITGEDSNEKIAQAAKRDPAAFAFFLEGLSLLAWDIAWLCRSQGFMSGTETWEDVCNIGRNLWMLLLSPVQSPAIMRVLSNRDVQNRQISGKEAPMQTKLKASPKIGDLSHSSAHSFLGAADAQERWRGWKFAKYTLIVDPLKKALWAEMNNAEWELLEEGEWDDGGEQFDEAVFIKTRPLDGRDYDDARSIMTARPRLSDDFPRVEDQGDPARAKGTSGWTKVKNREK